VVLREEKGLLLLGIEGRLRFLTAHIAGRGRTLLF
jgi:hypothetical protein